MTRPAAFTISTRLHPFMVTLYLWQVALGLAHLSSAASSNALIATVNVHVTDVWSAVLAAGGLVGLTGVLMRGQLTKALTVEQCGLLAIAICNGVYVAAIVHSLGLSPLTTEIQLAGTAVGCLGRVVQVGRDRRRVIAVETDPLGLD